MSIKQFNASYLVNEDRILFRFNTHDRAEYRLWFTRRVTLFILVATSHLLTKKFEKAHSIDVAKAMNEFGKQSILDATKQSNDVPNDFESGLHFPIGADPLLVMDVTCSLTKNDEKLAFLERSQEGQIDDVLSIDFLLPGVANLNLKLPENLMHGMTILLDQIRQNARWSEAVLLEKSNEQTKDSVDTKPNKNFSIH